MPTDGRVDVFGVLVDDSLFVDDPSLPNLNKEEEAWFHESAVIGGIRRGYNHFRIKSRAGYQNPANGGKRSCCDESSRRDQNVRVIFSSALLL